VRLARKLERRKQANAMIADLAAQVRNLSRTKK